MYIVPLTSDPNQNFRCTIPVNGQNMTFNFTARYNSEADYWILSVSNAITSKMFISDLVLLAGEYPAANILEQWGHLRIGSAVVVKINPDNRDDAPNAYNLGTDFVLVWGDNL